MDQEKFIAIVERRTAKIIADAVAPVRAAITQRFDDEIKVLHARVAAAAADEEDNIDEED